MAKISKIENYSRREFLALCGKITALLGLSKLWIPEIAHALEKAMKKPSVLWLNFAACTGCTESFIKAESPSIAKIVLDIISLDSNETIMAPAGESAESIIEEFVKQGGYICIIEGAIPTKKGYGTIAGKDMLEIAKEVASKAKKVLAIGACASFGGIPSAKPNPSGAKGVAEALKIKCVNLPGCPVNPEWVLSVIVHVLMFGRVPELDRYGRPKKIYGERVHDACERRAHYDNGEYAEKFGDVVINQNYCLHKLGCKGPETYSNCPIVKWNGRVNWCVGAGSPCIGCVEPGFPDKFMPFYVALPLIEIPEGATCTDCHELIPHKIKGR